MTITFLHGCSNEADHSEVGGGKDIPTDSMTIVYRIYFPRLGKERKKIGVSITNVYKYEQL